MRLLLIEVGTPYLVVLLSAGIGAFAHLFRQQVQAAKDIVELRTAFKFYLENTGKGAATVLDSPNPAPPAMRLLLRKHVKGALTPEERMILMDWLRTVRNDESAQRSERNAAVQLLASMGAMNLMRKSA